MPRRCLAVKAARNDKSGQSSSNDFNLAEYVEAKVEIVRHTKEFGHIIFLRLLDSKNQYLPVYIGDSESNALEMQLQHKQSARPMTHDFMKLALDTLGFRVTKVCVTSLVGNTYLARVHLSPSGRDASAREVDIDARPSDAINLAVRYNAPMYVSKQVANKMGSSAQQFAETPESHQEIQRSCRKAKQSYHDPTIVHRLNLQVAIAEERYDDACMIRDQVDKMLASDRALSLLVAMESALDDNRYEEAARCRDLFLRLTSQHKMHALEGFAEA
ncbi:probable bifunctional nuclease 1 [Coccomyxa sp. Obi]|nr:probable bifunctional nuclease 1 [Coccomyxa sp. Obi]